MYTFKKLKIFKPSNFFIERKNATFELKSVLASKISTEQEKIKAFRKEHRSKEVGKITVDQLYGGMRGMLGLICETSVLDPNEGIRFRGYSIPECQKLLPKAAGGSSPLPEGVFWLLLTGDIPSEAQAASVSAQWAERAALPSHVANMIKHFPNTLHPMAQFSAAIIALSSESKFARAYSEGTKKQVYWEYIFEDAMDVVAKLPVVAAKIYKHVYKDGKPSLTLIIDEKKDWSANLATMMGYDDKDFTDLLRLYMTIHCDHEGGNVSAHTVHLVGSALADPYMALAAGMSGLGGRLHGLANQEVLLFIEKARKELGDSFTDEKLKDFCQKTLKGGQVIPGFGHAVLRKTDPRYSCQRDFALKHFPNDQLVKIAEQLLKVVPPTLQETGKVQNPWPNVDANSGVCLQHYGLKEMQFYTVLFGVSRALGTMASLIWARALGLPIERPKSISSDQLMKLVKTT